MTLLLDSTQLEIALSATERVLAFHRGNIVIDRSTITKVQLTDDGWTWLRGVPSPGTHLRGIVAMGTWKSAGGDDFAIIRRHRPGVVIDLDGTGDLNRVILTTRHGLALVTALRLDVPEEAADVADIAAAQRKPSKPRVIAPRPATA